MSLRITNRTIGADSPCFIIAEAGVNHNGSMDHARRMIDVAVQAGADAVKFQTFDANRLVIATAPKAEYQQKDGEADESQLDMLRKLQLSRTAHEELFAYCGERNIIFLSTPFDQMSADLLDELGVAAYKIPSGEITNPPLLAYIARKGKPLLISTGMSTLGEVETAVNAVESTGNRNFALLHCVSSYPAAPADVNLRVLATLRRAFCAPVGYSDHTLGIEVALAAVALGACIIEKHFTLDRNLPGPDHRASAEPDELAALVRGVRTVEAAMGDARKRPVAAEQDTANVARKSITVIRDLTAGNALTSDALAMKRPGTGLPSSLLEFIVGRRLTRDVAAGTLLTWEMLA